MKNHPGDFCNKLGDDLYLNPWWALGRQDQPGRAFCFFMDEVFGPPDLWFQGGFHELLWGPREMGRVWRPSFHANLSGPSGKIYFRLWLPWRGDMSNPTCPVGANILDTQVDLKKDMAGLFCYAEKCKFPLSVERFNTLNVLHRLL